MIKVAAIGLGKMGLFHLKNSRFIDGVKVIAAADKSKRALNEARHLGIKKLFFDYKELLNHANDIDAAIIALPNFLHAESICAVAEKGVDIFVEKPLARTTKECEEIMKAVQKHGVKLMCGHNYRFFDSVEKTKEIIEEGRVGDVEVATLELVIDGFAPFFEPKPIVDWYFDKEKKGMGCLDSGFHLLDLFRWFFGDARVSYAYLGYRFNLPLEDSALVILHSIKKPTRGIVNVGWFSRMIFPEFNFRVNVHGTAGFVSTDHFAPSNMYFHVVKEATKNILRRVLGRKIHPLTYTYYYSSYVKELDHFFSCMKNDSNPMVQAKDGLEVVKMIEEIYEICEKTEGEAPLITTTAKASI